jgi:hypothetical protein
MRRKKRLEIFGKATSGSMIPLSEAMLSTVPWQDWWIPANFRVYLEGMDKFPMTRR